jgi:hypothetical protein
MSTFYQLFNSLKRVNSLEQIVEAIIFEGIDKDLGNAYKTTIEKFRMKLATKESL